MPRRTRVARRGDRHDPHQRISRIGGDGWSASEEGAITVSKRDLNAHWVAPAAGTVNGLLPDSLLALPECP